MAKQYSHLIPLSSLRCPRPLRDVGAPNLAGLIESISQQGLLKPIVVRADGEEHVVLDGVHRWQACAALGWEDIPAIVLEGLGGDAEGAIASLEMSLVKRDMSPMDKARCAQQWISVAELRQADVAKRMALSETKLSKMLSLLKLPKALQELVHCGALSETVGYELVRRYSEEELGEVALELMAGGLTNKQIVAKLSGKARRKPSHRPSVIRCGYRLHLARGRFVAMDVPECASIDDLKACLTDALAEIEAREAMGATLDSFASEGRERPGDLSDGGGTGHAA